MTNGTPPCSKEAFELLDQLEHILDHDPLIDEVGFIHPSQLSVLNNEADSTSLVSDSREEDARINSAPFGCNLATTNNTFFWNDHKLGISTAYLLPLYKVAKYKFMESLTACRMPSESSCNNEDVPGKFALSKIESGVMKHSRALLLLSSDFGTAWNARKLIISTREDFPCSDELLLSALILSFSPKSENAWSYRRWVIKKLARGGEIPKEILDKESNLVEKIAEKSKMNYRAWNHRCWLVSYMTNEQVLQELNNNKSWASLHVADSSCFHYRRKLMLQILGDLSQPEDLIAGSSQLESLQKLWKDELEWNEMLIRRYIGREALWLHRRFLSLCWLRHFGAAQQHPNEVDNHVKHFIAYELYLLQDCVTISESEFEDIQSQAIHAASYMLWLNRETFLSSNDDFYQKRGLGDLRTLLNRLSPEKTKIWDDLLLGFFAKGEQI